MESLPPGTWVQAHGIRRFVAADPLWAPDDSGLEESLYVLASLWDEPPTTYVPEWRAHRHICDCGCLLFGIENCPNCQLRALQNVGQEAV